MVNKKIYLLLSVLFCILISAAACGPPEDVSAGEDPTVSANRSSMYEEEIHQFPTDLPEKVDSIMERRLRELVEAYKKGEAEEYAKKRGIKLIDTGVKVWIQCKTGQVDIVTEKVRAFGVVELVGEIGMDAVIPIANLEKLLDIPDIRSISIPPKPITP